MEGSKLVLEQLQQLLNNELMARDQYLAHARLFDDWGLKALAARMMHEAEEETEHAQAIIDRMLFLEASPDMNQQQSCHIGADVKAIFENDLKVEYEVAGMLKNAISVCEQENDFVTRKVLTQLLDDTEMDHALWLEQQIRLIGMVGVENYVQAQMTATPSDEH